MDEFGLVMNEVDEGIDAGEAEQDGDGNGELKLQILGAVFKCAEDEEAIDEMCRRRFP